MARNWAFATDFVTVGKNRKNPVSLVLVAVRIPQHLAKEINLAEGSQVQLVLIDGRLTIEPITRRRYSLEELIDAITPENIHNEIDSGVAVGNEVW